MAAAVAATARQDNPLESPRSRALLRIAIDARKLHDYGIGTYVRNLLRELARQDDDAEYVLLCFPADAELLRALGPRFHPLVERSGNYSIREQFGIPLALTRAKVDLFHAPHYVVPPLTTRRFVVTIHDCIHLRFPQYLPNRAALYYARTMMTHGRAAIAAGPDGVAGLEGRHHPLPEGAGVQSGGHLQRARRAARDRADTGGGRSGPRSGSC